MTDRILINDLQFGIATDQGKVRDENQDECGVFALSDDLNGDPRGFVLIVADGMGGTAGGKIASQIAVKTISEYLTLIEDNFLLSMKNAIIAAEAEIKRVASEQPTLSRLGTTASVALYVNEMVFFAHIGDTRIYHLSNGSIIQISKDHTLIQELIDRGSISAEDALTQKRSNVLLRSLGSNKKSDAEFYESVKAKKGDYVLICSDGLWSVVTNDEIFKIITHYDAQIAANKLVKLANDRGGKDNISVVILNLKDESATDALIPANDKVVKESDIEAIEHSLSDEGSKLPNDTKSKMSKMSKMIPILSVVGVLLLLISFVIWDRIDSKIVVNVDWKETVDHNDLDNNSPPTHKKKKIGRNVSPKLSAESVSSINGSDSTKPPTTSSKVTVIKGGVYTNKPTLPSRHKTVKPKVSIQDFTWGKKGIPNLISLRINNDGGSKAPSEYRLSFIGITKLREKWIIKGRGIQQPKLWDPIRDETPTGNDFKMVAFRELDYPDIEMGQNKFIAVLVIITDKDNNTVLRETFNKN